MSGVVQGRAGDSVASGAWVANAGVAKAGARAERQTAAVLGHLANTRGYAVLHDLRMPLGHVKANIDHVVVTGTTVYLIDSKAWAPGFLWTVGDRSFRGLRPFAPAHSRTMVLARHAIETYLGRPLKAQPLVVVWWTGAAGRAWALRFPGARVVIGRAILDAIVDCGPADLATVTALSRLVRR